MRFVALAAISALALGCGQQAGIGGGGTLATADDSVSYILGYGMGKNLKDQSVPVTPELIFRGMREAMAGKPSVMPESVMQQTMMAFQFRMMNAQRERDSAAAIENEKAGQDFLASNKGKDGVKTTASGLQYKVISEGSGPKPKATSRVTVHYKGTLLNGDQFDSSYDRGQPATFALNGVIPGWTEGVQLMSKGAKYQFWIPANLAYGEQGSPPAIPPNSTLVFEVELLDFN